MVNGLRKCYIGEVIVFNQSNDYEIIASVANVDDENTSRLIIVKGTQVELSQDVLAFRTFHPLKTQTGFGVLGKVITPLGDLVDDNEDEDPKTIVLNNFFNIELTNIMAKSPSIIERETVAIPFHTGVSIVDCFTPIGCGQRQLVIGDINTGKTSLSLTMLLNQRFILNFVDKVWRGLETTLAISYASRALKFMPCIFVAIGKRRSEVLRLKRVLLAYNAMYYTTIVFTSSEDVPALQFFAPYAACAIGEWFMKKAYNTLVIFDDLSQQAVAYRQITLLLRRPPGREAYPGDIFYVQSRLLERGAQLSKKCGTGSLTVIPLIETKGGDIAAYIPTNVISITDGQVFLSSSIINKGLRPGVNIGLSVSRVGSKAQYNCIKYVSKKIKRDYILYKTYESLSKISSDMDPMLLGYVNRGNTILNFFSQKLFQTVRIVHQSLAFFCLSEGYLDEVNLKYVHLFFELYFKSYFVEGYLDEIEELMKYLITRNIVFIESIFIAISIEPSLKEIIILSKAFTSYFKIKLLPRLNDDIDDLYYNLLRASVKNKVAIKG